jgi:hypothetical protein
MSFAALRTEHHYVSLPPTQSHFIGSLTLYRVSPSTESTMTATTPISRSKTAAMSRIIDSICKGYRLYCCGTVAADKAERLARKLHERHAIGATPAQRLMRKKRGKANALLVMYWPLGAAQVEWLMLFTIGQLDSQEHLCDATEKHRLGWLGYELVRYPIRGAASWTWRRPKIEMADHYALLDASLAKRHHDAVEFHLSRIANQPGFHGVREQSWALCQHARQHGYQGELPHLFYVQKISHGERLHLGK